MIECVLATDMVNHTKHLNYLKAKMESYEIKHGMNIEKLIAPDNFSKNYENQQTILSNILHAADISNPSKPEKIYDQWIKKLFIEFFKQGDLERKNNLPISILCDRTTTNIEKAQLGFISYIVLPFWETLYNVIPNIETYVNNIKSNLKRFEEISNQEPKNNYKEVEK
jgi:cAMP-specific phosphodiesterase 4